VEWSGVKCLEWRVAPRVIMRGEIDT
jgi:hypothetical protein